MANCNLAKHLYTGLENGKGLKELFSKQSINKLRKKSHSYPIFGDTIRSTELSRIIEDAKKIQI